MSDYEDPGPVRVDDRDRPMDDAVVLPPAGPEDRVESDQDREAAEAEMDREAQADHEAAEQQLAEREAETDERPSPDESMVDDGSTDAVTGDPEASGPVITEPDGTDFTEADEPLAVPASEQSAMDAPTVPTPARFDNAPVDDDAIVESEPAAAADETGTVTDSTVAYTDGDAPDEAVSADEPEGANYATPATAAASSLPAADYDPSGSTEYTTTLEYTTLDSMPEYATPDSAVAEADSTVDSDSTVDRAQPTELSPGDIEATPVPEFWPAEAMDGLRNRWREVQLRFVDDPQGAVTEADTLVGEAIETLTTTLGERRADLAGWRGGGPEDTERLRMAVQRYREFLDRVLDL